jgi:hypothetical protein
MWRTWHDLKLGILHQLHSKNGGVIGRYDLVIFAVDEKCRNVNFLQILSEIILRERLHAIVGTDDRRLKAKPPKIKLYSFVHLYVWPIVAKERNTDIKIKLSAIPGDAVASSGGQLR